MVLSHPFHCPTRVIEGDAFGSLTKLLRGRRFAILSSAGWLKRGLRESLKTASLQPESIIAEVTTNPLLLDVEQLATHIPDVEVVVAFGGGSVIDAAKGALALKALDGKRAALWEHLKDGKMLPEAIAPLPLIAVPTTAGTGSEVTRWGTIWGEDGNKYSISDPRLYPTDAILDPALLLPMPRELALSTGLDAVSHAMEAVWNRRHGALTDGLAQAAIGLARRHLGPSLTEPQSFDHKRAMQTASVLSGLAMGTTQTALAHSISYPLTAQFGMPHGFACSFTLAEVARYNLPADEQRLAPIAVGLECTPAQIPDRIERWFEELGLAREVGRYLDGSALEKLGDKLITPARAANNLREVDAAGAKRIIRAAFDRAVANV